MSQRFEILNKFEEDIKVGVDFSYKNLSLEVDPNTFRETMAQANCVEIVTKGTGQTPSTYRLTELPTPQDRSICSKCRNKEIGCPKFNEADAEAYRQRYP